MSRHMKVGSIFLMVYLVGLTVVFLLTLVCRSWGEQNIFAWILLYQSFPFSWLLDSLLNGGSGSGVVLILRGSIGNGLVMFGIGALIGHVSSRRK